jgi:hypothetical protein
MDGAHDASGNAHLLERVLQGERINDRGQHAHLVRGDAVHVARRPGDTAKNIPAADYDAELDAGPRYFSYFRRQLPDAFGIDAEGPGARHHLAAKLQQYAVVFRHKSGLG